MKVGTQYLDAKLGTSSLSVCMVLYFGGTLTPIHCFAYPCSMTLVFKIVSHSNNYCNSNYCCVATVGSEQQHNQDLREIYQG